MNRSSLPLMLVAIVFCTALPTVASAETSEEVVSPPPETLPAADPASPEVVAWALSWRRQAVCEWRTWNRARSCLGLSRRYFAGPRPERNASAEAWREAGRDWKQRVRPGGTRDYQDRTRALVRRMTRPGGSGTARWMPLARWLGWPDAQLPTLLRVITRESGGNPRATNGQYRGLVQFSAPWYAGKFDPYCPVASLRRCLKAVREGGWGPWAATA